MKRLRCDGDGDDHDHDHDRAPNKQPVSSSRCQITSYAKTYLDNVKAAFKEQNQDFGLFQNIMRDYVEKKIDVVQVVARVKTLLKGRKDLIDGFNVLLPEGYKLGVDEDEDEDEELTKKPVVKLEEVIAFFNKVKKRFHNNEHIYEEFLDLLNSYRKGYKILDFNTKIINLFGEHQDLLEELTGFLPYSKASTFQLCNEQRISANPSLYKTVASNDDCDVGDVNPDLNGDKGMIAVHKKERKPANKVNRERTSYDVEDDINRKFQRKVDNINQVNILYNQGVRFCEKVKELNSSSYDYMAFLKYLHDYSIGKVEKDYLLNVVFELLGDSAVMDEFKDYIKHCEDIGRFMARSERKKLMCSGRCLFKSGNVNNEDEDEAKKHETVRAKEKGKYWDKYTTKSIQELDLSKCKKITPSYRLLPKDCQSQSQRSKLGRQVLNDRLVCVGSRSEDYSSKHKHMNQYEKVLFRCEDDKFEFDMLSNSVVSAAKTAEKLWEKIKDETTLESPFHIGDHFTVLNLRCIECLYGEHGLEVLEKLHTNPKVALPVILTRLKQKEEELEQCHSEFDKIWAQVFAENHHKSLDKQQNSRSLSAEPSESEIKETEEHMQKEDELLDTAAGMPFVEGSCICSTRKHNYIMPLGMRSDQLLSC